MLRIKDRKLQSGRRKKNHRDLKSPDFQSPSAHCALLPTPILNLVSWEEDHGGDTAWKGTVLQSVPLIATMYHPSHSDKTP